MTTPYLTKLLQDGSFHFSRFYMPDINNEPVFRVNVPEMVDQETCLFHCDVPSATAYLMRMHRAVRTAIDKKTPLPCVRFADGEYAFYTQSLQCNGLYRQAESKESIAWAIPYHVRAMKEVAAIGMLAPLIFAGNIAPRKSRFFSLFRKTKGNSGALHFLEFLHSHGIALTGSNYYPFYCVYAYLTSQLFKKMMNKKRLCLISSDFDLEACRNWFEKDDSYPHISFVTIPEEFVATQWPSLSENILQKVSQDCDICLVGAGIGSLLVCADVARERNVPAIDAGHVLNMMNGREDKSAGLRLYTLRKDATSTP